MCLHTNRVLESMESIRRHHMPWHLSYIQVVCKSLCGGWKLNPGSLVEQPVNLNVEPSVCPVQF